MKKIARALVGLLVASVLGAGLIVAGAGLWFRNAVYEDRSLPRDVTQLVIPKGATFTDITRQLSKGGVIANPLAFKLLGKLRHVTADVRAGEYRFTAHQSASDILTQLGRGGAQIAVWVTIPEGYTAREIAKRLEEAGLGPASEYQEAFLHDSIVINGQRTKNLEGYLVPSTYLIPTAASVQSVEKIFTDEFLKELPNSAASQARAVHLSIPQVITLASLVEREAKADDERALMAGVYYNRLKLSMPLEVDATIEYVFPEHKTEISRADLAIDTPYNTYKYAGLPPTPIANPGRPSIQAAFAPKASPYLYYVYKGDGHSAFAKTLQEHNANIARYLK
ncbi:MAG: endolytic transglycosylase MltG [Vulcanimicrobiaceae bacterium]